MTITSSIERYFGKTVDVYWNFHRKDFSVRHNGRVVDHLQVLSLGDVTFKVSEAGRQRVLREARKNVHAVIRGTVLSYEQRQTRAQLAAVHGPQWAVKYNPYRDETFMGFGLPLAKNEGEIIQVNKAKYVYLVAAFGDPRPAVGAWGCE